MTDTTPLSPAAQSVWDAAWANSPVQCGDIEGTRRAQVAAALRAAADLVTPENYKCFTGTSDWDLGSEARSDAIRDELLDIAAELEGAS